MKKDFHNCCDNKGPTVSIVQSSKNKLSCGYTSHSWASGDRGLAFDDSAWLMSLDTLTIYPLNNPSFAVCVGKKTGIDFGKNLGVGYWSNPLNGINGS